MLKGEIANSKNMASPFNVCYCWSVSVSVIISYKNWNIDFHAPTGALFYLLSTALAFKTVSIIYMHIIHIFIHAYFIFDIYLWLVFVYIFVDVYRRMCVRESARESEKDRNIDRNKN